ncbi:GntR family transcriptional regulator [Flexithrix dorotheae]|uniref:GntR family transcriptional regulator n=1 Tax=Flexithrix dorotheae TaxID=70993 RepID=UPI0005C55C44|nr:GntR family transcriptional regulator [Flexithrix dorotheae]
MKANKKLLITLPFGDDESVYTRLLGDISRGVFVSGDRLVTTKLAERYYTSINPVREALKQLEGEGFVTSQKNSGARVTEFEYAMMRDVFEILQLLEPYLLTFFIEEFTEDQMTRLEQIQLQMKQADQKDFISFRDLDTAFHWEMYRHHYNQSAVELWKNKRLILVASHGNLPISKSRIEGVLREHDQLMEKLKSGNKQEATEVLTRHIKNGGDYFTKLLRR